MTKKGGDDERLRRAEERIEWLNSHRWLGYVWFFPRDDNGACVAR